MSCRDGPISDRNGLNARSALQSGQSVRRTAACAMGGYIPELKRSFRVVTLEDGETIHNAFPDRRFRRPDR